MGPDLEKAKADEERLMRYSMMSSRERTLRLAGTAALSERKFSPFEKLRQTRGIVTSKRVPDNFEVKNSLAQTEYPKSGFRYEQPQTHKFRDTDPGNVLAFGQVDFKLLEHPDQIPNPGGISEHNPRPKFWADRERMLKEKQTIAEGLAGKPEWHMYHKKLPLGHEPMAKSLPDRFQKKEASAFLAKDKWESVVTELARTTNDTQVVGKPPIEKYFKRMKPENLQQEFDGTWKQFKVIS